MQYSLYDLIAIQIPLSGKKMAYLCISPDEVSPPRYTSLMRNGSLVCRDTTPLYGTCCGSFGYPVMKHVNLSHHSYCPDEEKLLYDRHDSV